MNPFRLKVAPVREAFYKDLAAAPNYLRVLRMRRAIADQGHGSRVVSVFMGFGGRQCMSFDCPSLGIFVYDQTTNSTENLSDDFVREVYESIISVAGAST